MSTTHGFVEEPELDALVRRTEGVQPWRRALHACFGLLVAFLPPALGLDRRVTVTGLAVAALVALLADGVRLRSRRLNTVFFRVFSSLASPREAGHVASSTWFVVGALGTWSAFSATVATPALTVLALADPAASVVGRTRGRTRLGKGSVLGTATFIGVALLVLWPQVGLGAAALAALAAAAVEVLPLGLDDNLTVPLACGAVLWWLSIAAA